MTVYDIGEKVVFQDYQFMIRIALFCDSGGYKGEREKYAACQYWEALAAHDRRKYQGEYTRKVWQHDPAVEIYGADSCSRERVYPVNATVEQVKKQVVKRAQKP